MNMKKILAAIAACAISAAMLGMTVCAAGAQGNEEEAGEEAGASTEEIPGGEGTEEIPGGEEAPAGDQQNAPAPNPQTGNSPVALAVIPVALAAAAVVAKKATK